MGAKTRNLVFPDEEAGYYTISTGKPYSEKTAEVIDAEIAELSEEASKTAEKILRANLKPLEELAEELLKKESLDEKELEPILKNVRMPA